MKSVYTILLTTLVDRAINHPDVCTYNSSPAQRSLFHIKA